MKETQPAAKRRRKRPPPLQREIIVKLREGGSLKKVGGRYRADHLSLERFHRNVESLEGAVARRSFRMPPARLAEIKRRAGRRAGRRLPSLDLFLRVKVMQTAQAELEEIVSLFSSDPEVEYACLAGVPGPPPSPDFTAQQDYMDPAPDGVNASYAWFFTDGDGSGVQVCDCEYGFNPSHEDLPPVNVVSNLDGDLTSWEYHGTAVLGELAGEPDAQGVTGICHGATMMFASESGGHRVDCINDAVGALGPGDVLVLEMQTGTPYKPAEYDPDVHALVSTATSLGTVVVAAAGNGSADLNSSTDANGLQIWNPGSPDYSDSGAIIVGAGGSTGNAHPHSKLSFSTYGDRVNCQGWGEDVVTTGDGDLWDGGPNADYTDTFNGTSSATPIVAGVVACLQGAARATFGAPLTPAAVRALLEDPANGTPQADSPSYPAATYHIGPLPDLPRVFKAAGIQPDVFMRDNVADTGIEPYVGGVLCWSPDIILRKSPEPNPDIAFGSATWGDANLSEKAELGQDNYVYVRLENRGSAADDVTVSVYWTEASGFLHPSTWNLLDVLAINGVAPGERRVAGPVLWPQAQIPPIGHYCLIAVINSARDPITVPGSFASVTEYLDFVRDHNNICYRNCDVEDVLPDVPAPPFVFLLRGLPDRAARFRLEVRHQLPAGAEVGINIKQRLAQFETFEKKKQRGKREIRFLAQQTRLKMRERRPLILRDVPLKRRAEIPVEVKVKLPPDTPRGEYLLYADQYLGDRHLGRVNYLLRVGRHE